MPVLITVSETYGGANFSDALEGGGSGIDYGSCINGQYAPIIDQTSNTGAKNIYIRHDATIDPITNVKTFVQQYGTGTGAAYGGANTAADDFTKLQALGVADNMGGGVANNSDGLGAGLHLDMDWDANETTPYFSGSRKGTLKQVFGDNSNGVSLATAYPMLVDAMTNTQGTGVETAATGAIEGTIGRDFSVNAAEAALYGDRAHARSRFYLQTSETEGGVLQWEFVVAFSYTA